MGRVQFPNAIANDSVVVVPEDPHPNRTKTSSRTTGIDPTLLAFHPFPHFEEASKPRDWSNNPFDAWSEEKTQDEDDNGLGCCSRHDIGCSKILLMSLDWRLCGKSFASQGFVVESEMIKTMETTTRRKTPLEWIGMLEPCVVVEDGDNDVLKESFLAQSTDGRGCCKCSVVHRNSMVENEIERHEAKQQLVSKLEIILWIVVVVAAAAVMVIAVTILCQFPQHEACIRHCFLCLWTRH
jgi:hypothetical protein